MSEFTENEVTPCTTWPTLETFVRLQVQVAALLPALYLHGLATVDLSSRCGAC